MGHRIPNHGSLCAHPHGHRYVAEITIEGPVIEEKGCEAEGMVKDFGEMKLMINSMIVNKWDHSFMVYKDDPFAAVLAQFERNLWYPLAGEKLRTREVDFIPTAENIAAEIFRKLFNAMRVVEVTVWETPNCKATVTA